MSCSVQIGKDLLRHSITALIDRVAPVLFVGVCSQSRDRMLNNDLIFRNDNTMKRVWQELI